MSPRERRLEPPVELTLEAMAREGWEMLRGSAPGEATCLVSGPGGTFAIEVRAQPGRGRVATVPVAWLRQATAKAQSAERWLGIEVRPLLVLRFAELDRSGAERDGVTVVAGRDLARQLRVAARRSVAA